MSTSGANFKCVANFPGSKNFSGAVGAQVASSNRVLTSMDGGVQKGGGGGGFSPHR